MKILLDMNLSPANGQSTAELGRVIKHLAPRWFLMRDVHARVSSMLLQPRFAMSLLRGPMTRDEIRRARELPVSGSVVPIAKTATAVQTSP